VALESSRADVRLAGLRLLSSEDRAEAQQIAAADPNERVRRWGATLSPPGPAPLDRHAAGAATATTGPPAVQLSLL
jgi:hypothetical protein